jgi:hypothetical protein
LRQWVADQLSPIAKPDEIRFTDNLPKTRSGKIMRRLLRAIARGEHISQDISTLENPAILEQLRGASAPTVAKKVAHKAVVKKRVAKKKVAKKTASKKAVAKRRPASKAKRRPAAERAKSRPRRKK